MGLPMLARPTVHRPMVLDLMLGPMRIPNTASRISDQTRPWPRPGNGEVVLLVSCLLAASTGLAQPAVVINEVMASNSTSFADPQGDFDDWIELYNAGDTPFDLAGRYLTDDPSVPTKWQIPSGNPNTTTISPRGYLVVWTDGDTGDAGLHASFRLNADGDEIHLFDSDGATRIDGVLFARQTSDISYGRHPDGGGTWRFFGAPTPGKANNEGFLGEVAPLRFSHERGFCSAAFDLTITTATPGAEILYTVDGRSPDDPGSRFPAGKPYTGPIHIGATTCLQAMAVKTGFKPTELHAHTYLFDSRPQVRSLPLVSLVGDARKVFYEPDGVMAIVGGAYSGGVWAAAGAGSYNNMLNRGLERPVSAEWITLDDDEDFHINCGLRVHGSPWIRPRYQRQNGYWSGNGKISLRLYFRGQYGANRLEYPLFAESNAEQFATIVLRAGHNDRNNPFIKDELLRRLHKDMGQVACMGTFANLFINGEHKGYYNPTEHVKEEACQQWFDSDEPWDVMTMNGVRDGDSVSWNDMVNYARSHNLADPAFYAEIKRKLDVVSFIDYLIIRLWPNDWDWPQNNWSAACERSAAGRWKFFVWDAEGTFVASQLQVDRFGELNSQGNANGYLYRALKANKDFRLLFADRLYRHFFNGGALTLENIRRRFEEMRDELRGVIPSMDSYIVDGWTPNRHDIFLNACTREGMYTFDGPTLVVNGTPQHGGQVDAGAMVQMIPSRAGATVYYTLDGSDPAQSAAEQKSTVLSLVAREAPKRVLVPTGPEGGDWRGLRAFDDSQWIRSSGYPGGVGYERSAGYEAYISADVGAEMYNVNGSCYVRIPFEFTDDRSTLSTMTLRVQYDDGFVAYLNSTEIARRNFQGEPAWNSTATASHGDAEAVVFESIDVSEHITRLRQGDNLLAIHGLNAGTTSSDLLITVELTANRAVVDEPPTSALIYTAPIPLTRSTRIKARVQSGNTWSALAEATFAVGSVSESLRISEIMYHPADPNTEYIELTNIGSTAINVNLARFTDGIDFTFPDLPMAPGACCLVVRDRTAFETRYGAGLPIAGQYTGRLNDGGEQLELQDAAGTIIHNFHYRDNWFRITDGPGFSLTVRDPATAPANTWGNENTWRPSVALGGSPGTDDGAGGLTPGMVVINELLANSSGVGPDWIELRNTTEQAVDVGGWFLSDDPDTLAKYEMAGGTTIAPHGYLVFTENRHFGNPNDPGCHESFGLGRDGETVYLHSGAQGVVTGYSERARFGPSDAGVTFGRYENGAGGFDLVLLTQPTPGAPNAEPLVGPIVISEIMYHAENSTDVEYVELFNNSDTEVTLYDAAQNASWRFTDDLKEPGLELVFPPDPPLTLGPRKYLLLVKDRTLFESRFSVLAPVTILEWGAGNLSNGGETIQLSRPGEPNDNGARSWICVDRVAYSDGSRHDDFPAGLDPWPTEADGRGLSLTRINTERYGDAVSNWQAATPSPGIAKQRPTH